MATALAESEQLSTLADKLGALAITHRARHLVALSFGAAIALQITLQHPGAFATLTIGSPVLGGGPFDPKIWQKYHEVKNAYCRIGHGAELRDLWMAPDVVFFTA